MMSFSINSEKNLIYKILRIKFFSENYIFVYLFTKLHYTLKYFKI